MAPPPPHRQRPCSPTVGSALSDGASGTDATSPPPPPVARHQQWMRGGGGHPAAPGHGGGTPPNTPPLRESGGPRRPRTSKNPTEGHEHRRRRPATPATPAGGDADADRPADPPRAPPPAAPTGRGARAPATARVHRRPRASLPGGPPRRRRSPPPPAHDPPAGGPQSLTLRAAHEARARPRPTRVCPAPRPCVTGAMKKEDGRPRRPTSRGGARPPAATLPPEWALYSNCTPNRPLRVPPRRLRVVHAGWGGGPPLGGGTRATAQLRLGVALPAAGAAALRR